MNTPSAGDAPLTPDQQRYLQTIFDYFRENSEWPTGRFLERQLLTEGLDAREIAKSLAARGDSQLAFAWQPDVSYGLSVPDLRLCLGSAPLLESFIRALRVCVARYLEDDQPSISNLDLMLKLHISDQMTRQVGLIFGMEPHLYKSMSQSTTGWEMGISDHIFELRNVHTLDDYLAARWKPSQPTISPEALAQLTVQRATTSIPNVSDPPSRDVFIVHGHDEAVREATARFIEQLGLRPIILHEQANQGLTIIEKFERHAQVAFAVVLLTPDDIGTPATTPDSIQPRARQNVILELGFFLGSLGRARVCALYKTGVELPSDMSGVVYISMDDRGAWKHDLARELKAAGIAVTDIP